LSRKHSVRTYHIGLYADTLEGLETLRTAFSINEAFSGRKLIFCSCVYFPQVLDLQVME